MNRLIAKIKTNTSFLRRFAKKAVPDSSESAHHQYIQDRLLYEQIILSTEDGIISKDLNGIITSWNQGAEWILGYTKEEAVGSHISFIIPKDRLSEEPTIIENARAGRQITHFETERVHKNGSTVFVSLCLSPIRSITGEVIGVSKILRDITSKKADEKKLLESERKYRSFFQDSPLPMWVIEFGTLAFLDVNETALKEYGYTREEFLSMTAYDIRDAAEKERLAGLVKPTEPWMRNTGIWKHRRKDGTVILAEVSAHDIQYENRTARLIMSIDVTEREAIRRQVEHNEKIYRTIASSIPGSIICMINKDRKYELLEGDMIEKLGYKKEDLIGKTLAEVLPEWRYKQLASEFDRALAGEAFSVENTRGEYHTISKFVPLKDHNGSVESVMIVVLDISELKHAQQRIESLNQGLEEKIQERTIQLATANKELESFSYSVSHDLRAPLRGIDGWSLALLEDYGESLDENAQIYLKRIRTETQRMGELIDDLLRLSRVSRTSIQLSAVNVSELAHLVSNRIMEMFPGRRFSFIIEENMIARADRQLLDIMLTNLFGNACKFTAKQPVGEITFGRKNIDGETAFFIRDNGVGFDMNHEKKLFGVFQRLHRQSEFPGTGIGLAIVQRIVLQHNGSIRAEASPGKGATFYFTINK